MLVLGTSSPNALLQLGNAITNRKIVLFDQNNNNNQYYGFGINGGVLRYQVSNTVSDHVFYADTSTTASTQLLRIKGNGAIALGGNTGAAKQVLTSNSNGSAPTWEPLGNIMSTGSSAISVKDVSGSSGIITDMPEARLNFNTTVPTRVILYYKIRVTKPCIIGPCHTKCFINVFRQLSNLSQEATNVYVTATSFPVANDGYFSDQSFGPYIYDLPIGANSFVYRAFAIFNDHNISFQAHYTLIRL